MEAVVFDLDGVLADSEGLHAEALARVARLLGVQADLMKYVGWSDADAIADMLRLDGSATQTPSAAELLVAKSRAYAQLIDRMVPFPGAVELARSCAGRWRTGLCTATLRHDAAAAIARLGLAGVFRAIVAFEDTAQSKPHPAPYVCIAGRLGADPRGCVAIEDSERGVESAVMAGFTVLAVGHTSARASLVRAHSFVRSLEGLTAASVESLARDAIARRGNEART